jgi:hypothetical protein
MAYKSEHGVDLDSGAIVAVTLHHEGDGGPERARSRLFGAAGEGHGARIRRLARPGSSVHVFRQLNSAWGMKLDADPKRYFYNGLIGFLGLGS